MGLTVLELEVANPASPEITEKVEFLIDSGAAYSVVPAPVLGLASDLYYSRSSGWPTAQRSPETRALPSSSVASARVEQISSLARRGTVRFWAPLRWKLLASRSTRYGES
jgi:hypothetical protein